MLAYTKELSKYPPFSCPYCHRLVSPFEFHYHCRTIHQFDGSRQCVWCLGSVQWQKEPPTNHLVKCLNAFMKRLPSLIRIDLKEFYECQKNSEKLQWDPNKAAQLKILPLQQKEIEMAVAAVQTFLKLSFKTNWYQITLPLHESCSSIQSLHPDIVQLPFSCSCETHRHFIIYTPKSIKASEQWKPIQSEMQLIETLGKVGRNYVRCPFFLGKETCRATIVLPLSYDLLCVLQWVGGIMEWIRRRYEKMDPKALVSVACSVNGLWCVRVGDLPRLPKQCVLPVRKYLEPSAEKGAAFCVELTEKKKMFFSYNFELEKMPLDTWLKWQAEKGNSLFEIIKDEIWFPSPYQQKCIQMVREVLVSKDVELLTLKKRVAVLEEEFENVDHYKRKLRLEKIIAKLWNS